jgi:hypothetical protein
MLFIGILIGLLLGYGLSKASGSSDYRKLLTNLFVAGKIRKLASEKNISLAKEYKVFKSFAKRNKASQLSLDNQIEEELKNELLGDDIDLEEKEVKIKK